MSLAALADDEARPSPAPAPSILLAEADAGLRTSLCRYLEQEGMLVREAADGPETLAALIVEKPDILVLDHALPGLSGPAICRHLRRSWDYRDLPVILCVEPQEANTKGHNCGADEYLIKPFARVDIVTSIRVLLQEPADGPAQHILRFQDIRMDLTARRVFRNGRPIHLGLGEFRLLRFFLTRPGHIFTREEILGAVWPRDAKVMLRTVDIAVSHLRKALNRPDLPDHVRTVPHVGYGLVGDAGSGSASSDSPGFQGGARARSQAR
jgi:two-component system phosphate regulon response regulator PhoB